MALVVCVLLSTGARARAQHAQASVPKYALEVDLTLGTHMSASFAYNRGEERALDWSGFFASIGTTFRSPYFVAPYVDVSYLPLFSGPPRDGSSTAARLSTFAIAFGPSLDLTPWLRVRGLFGLFNMLTAATVDGDAIRASQWNLGWVLAATFKPWRFDRFHIGPDVRAWFISEASVISLSIGVTGTFDAFRWD